MNRSNSGKNFFKKPNIIKIQNIVLGLGPKLLNKDDLCLFRMLRITAFKAIIVFFGESKNVWLDLVYTVHYGEDNVKLRAKVYILKRYVQL